MRIVTALILSAALLAASALLASAASAREAWNQQTVTALATELADATKALKQTLRKDPDLRDGYRQGDPVVSRYANAIDGIDRSARQLAKRLAAGEGYEETLGVAKKIDGLVREAEVQGAKIMTTVWMEEKLRPVEDLLARLGRYYFD
jgi:Tfp pilus assembly protein PilV